MTATPEQEATRLIEIHGPGRALSACSTALRVAESDLLFMHNKGVRHRHMVNDPLIAAAYAEREAALKARADRERAVFLAVRRELDLPQVCLRQSGRG